MIVDLDTAIYLSNLGYKNSTVKYYDSIGNLHYFIDRDVNNIIGKTYSAPEIFDAVNWLWKERDIKVFFKSENDRCIPMAIIKGKAFIVGNEETPEEALSRALNVLIKLEKQASGSK